MIGKYNFLLQKEALSSTNWREIFCDHVSNFFFTSSSRCPLLISGFVSSSPSTPHKKKKKISVYILQKLSYQFIYYKNYYCIYISNRAIGLMRECSPMVRETRFQSHVKSYQKLKKWYLILLCFARIKLRIKGKVEQSREWCCALPYNTVL